MLIISNLLDKKSQDLIELKCYCCNTSFDKKKKLVLEALKIKKKSYLFCSLRCRDIHNGKKILSKCNNCNVDIERSKKEFLKSKTHFCSQSCSAIYHNKGRDYDKIWTSEKRLKMREWAKKHGHKLTHEEITKNRKRRCNSDVIKICPACLISFNCKKWSKKKYCSLSCCGKKGGGYRNNSGRGKMGWYKGYFCQSSWELAWVIYALDNDIKFIRNKKGFPYKVDGKIKKYFPDFILEDGSYLEIKGWGFNTKEKIEQFPYKLKVIYKNEIKFFINYAINKYGKDFIKVYN